MEFDKVIQYFTKNLLMPIPEFSNKRNRIMALQMFLIGN